MQVENIVWDWNGTLLNDVELSVGIVNEILRDHQLPALSLARYRQIFDFPVQQYYERAGMDFTSRSFGPVSERFCEQFDIGLNKAELYVGAREVLSQLKLAGVRQFVLSSTEHETLGNMIERYGVELYFDAVKGMPDGLARGKAGIGEALLQECALSSANTVMVGDTVHDWAVAEQLGIGCVLVATGHHDRGRLADAGCLVVDSLAELVDELGFGGL